MYAWEQIQQTVDYIDKHLGEELAIDNLAEMASLSPFYYQRLFKRLVKKPVGEYIKLRRMGKATEALLQKDSRILDIALELGFTSHEHFTRTFKETFGMTPEEYRRNPTTLNRMTKPELSLNYVLVGEGVPLVTEGIVIEIKREQTEEAVRYAGFEKKMPVAFLDGIGCDSGVDPLGQLWDDLHEAKDKIPGLMESGEEAGVTLPCSEEGFFRYFAGARIRPDAAASGYSQWELPAGEYVVCSFEAENFMMLVTDALYKALNYVYGVWLPGHGLQTEGFCAELYASHTMETTSMEIWMKLITDREEKTE